MDLTTISGLPMQLNADGSLTFPPEIVVDETRGRALDELTGVYLDQESARGSQPAYWMYNGVYSQEDAPALGGLPIRYELTLFPDSVIGAERVKTHGHIHTPEPRSGIDYPEICEVLVGTAHFFFQDLDLDGPSASRAFFIEVKAGQKLVIPPGYEHLTINAGPGPMLFSDVVSRRTAGIYDHLRQARGAAYLEVVQDSHTGFIANPHYRSVPPLQSGTPRAFPSLMLHDDIPLYRAFVETRGEKWPFLDDPSAFLKVFPDPGNVFQFS